MVVTNDRLTSDALASLEPSFLKENEAFVEVYRSIEWSDIDQLNKLVIGLEQIVLKYQNPNSSIKNSLDLVLQQILWRFPLFFGYWKKYTAVTYQLFGLEKSIEVLAKSVASFPNSLELWCDYLKVLRANSAGDIDFIRNKFKIAKDLVGYQFLSDKFWDQYIEFETKNSEKNELNNIYMELVTIPLHQYARYGTTYKKLLQSGALRNSELDIDITIRQTQRLVNAIWPFECKIKQTFFNLKPVAIEELENWKQYLDFIDQKRTSLGLSDKLVKTIHLRCLVVCNYYEYFWGRYTNILRQIDYDLVYINSVYKDGCKVLPRENKQFRLSYLEFLMKDYKRNENFVFMEFTKAIATFLDLWPRDNVLMKKYLMFHKLHEYGTSTTQSDKEIMTIQTAYCQFLNEAIENYINKKIDASVPLQDMMTDNTLPVIVVELINTNWLVLKNTMQTIKLFNKFAKNAIVSLSTAFWLTYYKFEKSSKNFSKLNKFVTQLGSEIVLPSSIILDIMSDYRAFYLTNANVSMHYSLGVSKDSNDNEFFDPVLYCQMKADSIGKLSTKSYQSADWHKTREFKENGHPGVFVEKPQIINSTIEKLASSFNNHCPPLPHFRNLEKINQPVKYDVPIFKD